MFNRIDHTEITTRDMAGSVKFYTEILGFEVTSQHKMDGSRGITEIVFMKLGDTSLELLEVPNAEPIPEKPQVGYRMMAITVDDMPSAIKYLKEKGVTISREPMSLGESWRGEFLDNNGIAIEIRQW
ncbi:VOC family protein [Candidatus Bathyarchaeota archaeon]|nr:VOC family protein [Candidatus Bathyarchaeota archaeon]